MKKIFKFKNLMIILQAISIIFLLIVLIGGSPDELPSAEDSPEEEPAESTDRYQLDRFPVLTLPLEYFDTERKSIGAGSYFSLVDIPPYQSYPSTEITIPGYFYSTKTEPLPPVKSDEEIYELSPEEDFFGSSIAQSIEKYGGLARRFAGEPGLGLSLYAVEKVDVTDDGEQELILSINQMGANVVGKKNVIVKDNQIIFSTALDFFSVLTPAENNNGFFLQWSDNFKFRDGFVTTRFIYNGEKFVPVYEQLTRYVRWSEL
jgi:hypothetical protein